jgi:hypothetical protein
MVNKTFILAFNQLEARSYIKKNPGEYTVLHSPDQIRMERTPRVMIMPNAYRREDYNDMMDAINIRRGIIVR